MMFQHLLVPADLSTHAVKAVQMARDLARSPGARITLFHVIETLAGAEDDEFESFYRELEGRANRQLTSLAARLGDAEIEVARTVVYGRPAEEIVRFAAENSVDLIVLASHRIDVARPGQGWGTLSYKVGLLAPCSVLLVK